MIATDIGGLSGVELSVILAALILLFGWKTILEACNRLAEELSNLRGGGPRSPSHPLPADDSVVLNRRRRSRRDFENDETS